LLDQILEYRAVYRAKQIVDGAKSQMEIPAGEIFQLVVDVEMEIASEDVAATKRAKQEKDAEACPTG